MQKRIDFIDLAFRLLFSSIFLGLGFEHLLQDNLIQKLMPAWIFWPRVISIICGLILVTGGGSIFLGYQLKRAAILLGSFVIIVTILVHVPGVLERPENLAQESYWLWDILQRSNLVKNLCLLGVCIKLLNYKPGRLSLDYFLNK